MISKWSGLPTRYSAYPTTASPCCAVDILRLFSDRGSNKNAIFGNRLIVLGRKEYILVDRKSGGGDLAIRLGTESCIVDRFKWAVNGCWS